MRILLVDDDRQYRFMLGEYFCAKRFEVDLACDGLDALSRLNDTVYDVIVTDVEMPRMDGIELLKELRQVAPGTPVVVISGNAIGNLGRMGASAYLEKPFELRHLESIVANLGRMPEVVPNETGT